MNRWEEIEVEVSQVFEGDDGYYPADMTRQKPVKAREPLTPELVLLRDYHVAELLKIGVRTVWSWASSGEIPKPIHVGRLAKWRRRDIEAWLARKR